MDLRDYARTLLKRGWIILFVTFVTTLSAIGFSKMQTPLYQAIINLNVRPSRITDWGSLNSIKIILRNYAWNIKNDVARAREVDAALGLDMSPYKLLGKIETASSEADLLIKIVARDPQPDLAQAMVEKFAQLFVRDIEEDNLLYEKQDQVFVKVAGEPQVSLFSPKTKINALVGILLGSLLGGVFAFGLEYLDDTIKTAEDVERYVGGLTVLGTIPTITPSEASLTTREHGRPFSWPKR